MSKIEYNYDTVDIWNRGYDNYCTKVYPLEKGMEIAVPSYLTSNKSLASSVETISTSDCSLNLFSLDQIAQSDANANAKYGISLVCPGNNFKALGSNFLNSDLGTCSSILDNRANEIINSDSSIWQKLQILCLSANNSSSANSGIINFPPFIYTDWINFLVNDSGLKKENNMLASTMISLIYNYDDIPYLLARLPLYSSTSLDKLPFESLLFFNMSSTTLNRSNTLSLSSTALLNNSFVAGFSSSSFMISSNLSEILTFNSGILLSPYYNDENDYLKVVGIFDKNGEFEEKSDDITFQKITYITGLGRQQVYNGGIEGSPLWLLISVNTSSGENNSNFKNSELIIINLSIPTDEPAGPKYSNLTFAGVSNE